MRSLQREPTFTEIVGIDVSARALEGARRRLRVEEVPGSEPARVRVLQGALTYRDRRLEGFDAAAIVEVVEHLDPQRLEAFERVVFEFARPRVVLITTPNIEYNAKLPGLTSGQLRHADHRFEWTRAEFGAWVARIGKRFGYGAHVAAVGPEDPELGPPTLMAVLTRLPAS